MDRRDWFKKSSLLAGAAFTVPRITDHCFQQFSKPVLKIAHITDVHVRPEQEIPMRVKKCLEAIKEYPVDFVLNGGDVIHAADYEDISRERVLEQWAAWDECKKTIDTYEIYSCLGNHDMWWAAPDENDCMYGKKYVTERLQMPDRYYSFSKKGWHFIILDSNNKGISLDPDQMHWLENELENLAEGTPVLVMTHCPILTVTGRFYPNDQHSDAEQLVRLFYKYKEHIKICVSGHMHLLDSAIYNNVHYFCNGALSGFWWGEGGEKSAKKGYYHQTAPGFAMLTLYGDGHIEREYVTHSY